MNTSMKKAISLVTCTALAAGCCTMAFAADSPVTKDENVFLFLNPDGSIQSQVVSDWLHSDNGLRGVTDRTSLTDITNLKSGLYPEWRCPHLGHRRPRCVLSGQQHPDPAGYRQHPL